MRITERRPRVILDFDIENRPLSYWIPDRPTSEITSIAWSFVGEDGVTVRLLGRDDPEETLRLFREAWDRAEVVTGHYILRHDIPIVQMHMLEYDLPPLDEKMVHDTKVHMIKKQDQPATQEYLAELFGVALPKVHMTQHDWREANRLTPAGLAKTERRVTGDVLQHKLLRIAMVDAGALHPPKLWRP